MSSAPACPIEKGQVNEKVARVCSTLVLGVLFALVWLPWAWAKWVALGLTADYFMRSFVGLGSSPLSLSARAIVASIGFTPKLVNAGPKTFAARLGFFCAVALSAGVFLNLPPVAYAVAGMIAFCALLEAALGYCVGCKIYSILIGLLGMAEREEHERN